jgi:REP element-mobilizing transposase RayT
MPYDPSIHTGRLKRLERNYYQGQTSVHWVMCIEGRRTGWLDQHHHAAVRELLCHSLFPYGILCPAYCLMPDHGHFLWIGFQPDSDHCAAARHFRRAWNQLLAFKGFALSRQSYDHVLRKAECARSPFAAIAEYILRNPERRGLVRCWSDYPNLGSVIPGYPGFDPRKEKFWIRFWRIYDFCVVSGSSKKLTDRPLGRCDAGLNTGNTGSE